MRLRLAPAIGEIGERVVALRDRTRATPFYVSPTILLIRWRGGLRCEIDEPPVVGTCAMVAGFAAPSRVRPLPPRAEGKRSDREGSEQYQRGHESSLWEERWEIFGGRIQGKQGS